MVRSVKNHHEEEEEEEDEEFVSRTTDASSLIGKVDGKSTGQKGNALRSKHSETEQRRRCKINERFQMLKDLLPQNDQKRDKASLLLEVIEYIQFLQEKLQMYEGPYQGWTQEPSKLMPWKSNCAPVESCMDPSQLLRDGSGQEDNIVVRPMLPDALNSAESDLGGAGAYDALDHSPLASNQAIPTHIALQSSVLEDVPTQPRQTSISYSGNLASQSQSQFWQLRQSTSENAGPSYVPLGEQEELKVGSAEASFSNAYSQGLLNTLTQVLQSSGVDLSQSSISVQLDVGKRVNTGPTTTFGEKDPQNQSPCNQPRVVYGVGSSYDDSGQVHKRLRTKRI